MAELFQEATGSANNCKKQVPVKSRFDVPSIERDIDLTDELSVRLGAELIAVESVLIRVLANLAAANDNSRRAISAGFDEAADLLEQRAAGCLKSPAGQLDVEALRIVEELRNASLGKPKLRAAV